MLKQLFKH